MDKLEKLINEYPRYTGQKVIEMKFRKEMGSILTSMFTEQKLLVIQKILKKYPFGSILYEEKYYRCFLELLKTHRMKYENTIYGPIPIGYGKRFTTLSEQLLNRLDEGELQMLL